MRPWYRIVSYRIEKKTLISYQYRIESKKSLSLLDGLGWILKIMAVSLNATCVLPVSPNFGQAKHCQKGPEDQGGRQELALTTSLLRKALSVVGVKAQARPLLSRLETIGPRAAAAAGRRNNPVLQRWTLHLCQLRCHCHWQTREPSERQHNFPSRPTISKTLFSLWLVHFILIDSKSKSSLNKKWPCKA